VHPAEIRGIPLAIIIVPKIPEFVVGDRCPDK